MAEFFKNKTFKGRNNGLFLTLTSVATGTQRGVPGSKNSIFLKKLVLENTLKSQVLNDLTKEDKLTEFNAGLKEAEKDQANAILAAMIKDPLERTAALAEFEEGPRTIGVAIAKVLDEGEKLMNENAVFFRNKTHRITANFHNKTKMLETADTFSEQQSDNLKLTFKERREKAFQRWRNFTQPLLSERRVFASRDLTTDAEKEKFMRQGYQALTDKASRFSDDEKSVSAKLRESQVFEWNNVSDWVDYNRKYGAGTLKNAIDREISITAQRVAQLDRVGELPFQFMNDLIEKIQADPERFGEQALTESERFRINNTMRIALGQSGNDGSSIARGGKVIRQSMRMAQLGGITSSAIPDLALITNAARRFTGGWLSATGELFNTFASRATEEEKPFVADALRTAVGAEQGHLGRFVDDGMTTGDLTKFERVATKLSLITHWDAGWRKSLYLMSMRHLWHLRDIPFKEWEARDAKFGARNVDILKRFDITGDIWDVMRKQNIRLEDGRDYMFPEAALQIPRADIEGLLRKEGRRGKITDNDVERKRRRIRDQFAEYHHDVMDSGIVRPDAAIQGMLGATTPAGTAFGQSVRFLAMYKSWAPMWMKRGIGELMYGQGANSFSDAMLRGEGDRAAMAQLLIYGMGLGYVSLLIKAFLSGRTPPDPTKANVIIESFLAGGAPMVGFGSIFMQDQSGFNRNYLDALVGPAGRDVKDGLNLLWSGFHGPNAILALTDLLRGNIWGANLPGVHMAFQALLFHPMQEFAHPGSIERSKQNLFNRTGERSFGG